MSESPSLRDHSEGLDPGSFGGLPYSDRELAFGYGTKFDPRFANPYDIAAALMASQKREATLRNAILQMVALPVTARREMKRIGREALSE